MLNYSAKEKILFILGSKHKQPRNFWFGANYNIDK